VLLTAREHTQREEGLPEQVHREHVAIFEAIASSTFRQLPGVHKNGR
jgi:hypothetical protein